MAALPSMEELIQSKLLRLLRIETQMGWLAISLRGFKMAVFVTVELLQGTAGCD